jgi:6-pyruvoyltetrahydropterin/6-carboxytetrahydropterin synthase
MHTVSVERDFIAQHFLVGGDWGAENQLHSHHYRLELELKGEFLDQHNYLVDIVEIENILLKHISMYKDKTLNDLPAFSRKNPSLELFSKILCQEMSVDISARNILKITVKLWENQIAWASFELER